LDRDIININEIPDNIKIREVNHNLYKLYEKLALTSVDSKKQNYEILIDEIFSKEAIIN
jgi:hypothetical protein